MTNWNKIGVASALTTTVVAPISAAFFSLSAGAAIRDYNDEQLAAHKPSVVTLNPFKQGSEAAKWLEIGAGLNLILTAASAGSLALQAYSAGRRSIIAPTGTNPTPTSEVDQG